MKHNTQTKVIFMLLGYVMLILLFKRCCDLDHGSKGNPVNKYSLYKKEK